MGMGIAGPPGLRWRGTWSSGAAYVTNDVVTDAGSTYVCVLGHTNHEPPNATYWTALGGGSVPPAVSAMALTTARATWH